MPQASQALQSLHSLLGDTQSRGDARRATRRPRRGPLPLELAAQAVGQTDRPARSVRPRGPTTARGPRAARSTRASRVAARAGSRGLAGRGPRGWLASLVCPPNHHHHHHFSLFVLLLLLVFVLHFFLSPAFG